MKFRESGMPEVEQWSSFFNPEKVLGALEVTNQITNLIDIGCGYGTFTIPASKIISGEAIGIDIDNEAIEIVKRQMIIENISNIKILNGDVANIEFTDFLKKHYGPVDYICLFNILHCEDPIPLLQKSFELLKADGLMGVTHWIQEATPRGPSMSIRPAPHQIIHWCQSVGFQLMKEVHLPPYHFGQVYRK